MLMLFSVALAVCDPTQLVRANQAAQSAFVLGDASLLRKELHAVERLAGCPEISAEQAHLYHLTLALGDALKNDWDRAEDRLVASVAALPTAELAGPVAQDYRFRLAFQRAQERGIAWSLYEGGPRNGGVLPVVPNTALVERRSLKGPLRVVAVTAGVAALGMYGGAWLSRSIYDDREGGTAKEVLPSYRLTNGLAVAAPIVGGVGLTTFGVSFVVR